MLWLSEAVSDAGPLEVQIDKGTQIVTSFPPWLIEHGMGCRASVALGMSLPCGKRSWLAVACLDPETLHVWGMAQGKAVVQGMAAWSTELSCPS